METSGLLRTWELEDKDGSYVDEPEFITNIKQEIKSEELYEFPDGMKVENANSEYQINSNQLLCSEELQIKTEEPTEMLQEWVTTEENIIITSEDIRVTSYEKEQKWLRQLAEELLDPEKEPDQHEDNSDDDEADHVSERNGDSESEQDLDDCGIVDEDTDSEEGVSRPTEENMHEDMDSQNISEASGNFRVIAQDSKSYFTDGKLDSWYIGKDKITKWKKYCPPQVVRSKTTTKNMVTHLPGVKQTAKDLTDPVELWRKFFDNSVIDIIVQYTNRHIETFSSGKYSRDTYTKPTDSVEIEGLIGLMYLCAVKKCNRVCCEEIFKTDGSAPELFRLTLSMQRFLFLLRHIRFDDHDTRLERKATDKLAPIREVFEKVVGSYKEQFSPSQFTTVDEMLVAFRGKCPFRQYIPSKTAKYGIKIFALTDAEMFYTINMEVYVGKQPQGSPYQVSNSPLDVVSRLIVPISGTHRNVTTKWFTSVELCDTLLNKHELTVLGTIRKNERHLPLKFAGGQDRSVPSSVFAFRHNCTLVSHVPKQKKNVLLISSMHDGNEIDRVTEKPIMVLDYDKTKIGVDVVDQMSSNCNVSRNTRRWPMVIFYALLNISGINAYIIHNCNQLQQDQKITRREFLTELAIGLAKNQMIRRQADQYLPRPIRTRIKEMWNLPSEQDVVTPDELPRSGRCVVCTSKRNRKTRYFCKLCLKFLCLEHSNVVCSHCLSDKF